MYQAFVARRNGHWNIFVRHISGKVKAYLNLAGEKALELVEKIQRIGNVAGTSNSLKNYLDLLLSVN